MIVDVIQLKNKQDNTCVQKNIMTKTDSRVKINLQTVTSPSALNSGVSSLGSSPGWGHCIVFLGKTFDSHIASLHPGV